MRHTIKPQKLFRAHDTDPKPTHVAIPIKTVMCLHCGRRFEYGLPITYTKLSNGKLIWWCRNSCTPDNTEENEN